jgi:membrane-associated phospholipid phosphatase
MRGVKFLAAAVLLPAFLITGLKAEEVKERSPVFRLACTGPDVDQRLVAAPGELSLRTVSHDLLKDAGQIWSYPAHVQGRDLLPIFVLGTTIGILIPKDEGIARGFRTLRDEHAWANIASRDVKQFGFLGAIGTVAAFLSVGLIGKDHRALDTALLSASAMLQTAFATQVFQSLSGRQCPRWDDCNDHWAGPAAFLKRHERGEGFHYGAFPSGHTSAAFCLATVISHEYGEHIWVPIVTYALATGVGLSMVTQQQHWMSDVVAGAALGYVIGRLVVRNHFRRHHMQATVTAGPGLVGISASYHRP